MSSYIVRYTLVETREIVVAASSEEEAERMVSSGRAFDSQANPLFGLDKWIDSMFHAVDYRYTRTR